MARSHTSYCGPKTMTLILIMVAFPWHVLHRLLLTRNLKAYREWQIWGIYGVCNLYLYICLYLFIFVYNISESIFHLGAPFVCPAHCIGAHMAHGAQDRDGQMVLDSRNKPSTVVTWSCLILSTLCFFGGVGKCFQLPNNDNGLA